MGQVVINIPNPRVLERVFYWIIIIVLGVLLVFSYIGDDSPSTKVAAEDTETTTNTADEEVNALVPEVEEEPAVPSIDATCSDDIKNQDETGIDCGGVCTDINGRYEWADGKCYNDPEPTAPELSGKIDFSVSSVEEINAPGNGTTALKVGSFKVKVTNGKNDNAFLTVRAYAKSTGGVYLNQFGDSLDDYTVYMGPFDVGKITSGESVTKTFNEAGSYIFEQTGYDLGEEFKLIVELLDDGGSKIDQVTKTVRG